MTPQVLILKPRPSVRASLQERWPRLGVALVIGAAIFWIDTFTALSSAVAVLYVVVLMLAADVISGRGIWMLSVGCAALAVVSFLVAHGHAPSLAALLRLVFSLAAISAAALLMQRNHAARQLLVTQARLLDVTSDALFTRDWQGRVSFWNRGAERLYGWPCAEMLGRAAHEVLDTRFPEPLDAILEHLSRKGRWEGEIVQRRRDGEIRTVLSQWTLELDEGRQAVILETNTDVTQLHQAIEALRRSEARYRTIFDTLAVSIWEHDFRPVKAALEALHAAGVTDLRAYLAENPQFVREARAMVRITDVNATALKMMGVAEKTDFFAHLHDFLPETDQSFEQCLIAIDEGHERFESETAVRSRSGELIPVIVALSFPPGGACLDSIQASVFNLTERRRLQARLDQARAELDHALRAASIGVLTASIAHEVNQPISAASNAAGAARRWLAQDPPNLDEAHLALADVARASDRAGEVVKSVRNLLAQAPTRLANLAVDPLVAESARWVSRDLEAACVELILELGCAQAQVAGERVLLQQVLINLMLNAAQAMSETPAPRILTLRSHLEAGHVVLDVLDTGPGFSEEAAERACQAFYTTKASGMGLGLAICASTVAAHEGSMHILAAGPHRPGGQVRIRLPLADRPD